jgi:hypothetical protein
MTTSKRLITTSRGAAWRGRGGAVRGDATRLPVASGSVGAVTFMWLLHLVDEAVVATAIAEAARVLRRGRTSGALTRSTSSRHSGSAAEAGRQPHAPRPHPYNFAIAASKASRTTGSFGLAIRWSISSASRNRSAASTCLPWS